MEISLFNHWKQTGETYQNAVSLYAKYGKSSVLKALFAKGESPFNWDKIQQELAKIAIKEPTSKAEGLPPNLQTEHAKLGDIIGQMSHMHAKLEEVDDNKRKELAADILKLAEKRRNIFNRIDNYKNTGNDLIPAQIPEKATQPDPFKKLLLLRAQRSKLKKNPARVADFNKVVEQIAELEKILKP